MHWSVTLILFFLFMYEEIVEFVLVFSLYAQATVDEIESLTTSGARPLQNTCCELSRILRSGLAL